MEFACLKAHADKAQHVVLLWEKKKLQNSIPSARQASRSLKKVNQLLNKSKTKTRCRSKMPTEYAVLVVDNIPSVEFAAYFYQKNAWNHKSHYVSKQNKQLH